VACSLKYKTFNFVNLYIYIAEKDGRGFGFGCGYAILSGITWQCIRVFGILYLRPLKSLLSFPTTRLSDRLPGAPQEGGSGRQLSPASRARQRAQRGANGDRRRPAHGLGRPQGPPGPAAQQGPTRPSLQVNAPVVWTLVVVVFRKVTNVTRTLFF